MLSLQVKLAEGRGNIQQKDESLDLSYDHGPEKSRYKTTLK
jgi:hypothetical protein